jgi:hypothetical protein
MGDRVYPSAESKFSKPGAETTKASTKRATLAGFVSSAVLKSDNNGLFSAQATEEVKERTEAEERRLEAQSRADARPLYEQLLEQREAKDTAWKEANNPFKPPPGLDEEDVAYFEDRASTDRARKRKVYEQGQNDMMEFALARAQVERSVAAPDAVASGGGGGGGGDGGSDVAGGGGSGGGGAGAEAAARGVGALLAPKRPTQQSVLATLKVRPVLKKARKGSTGDDGNAASAASMAAAASAAAAAAPAAAKPKPAVPSGLASLGGYGGSSSSSDDD